MVKVLLVFEKYSDWLEAYSAIANRAPDVVECHYIENDRNDERSVRQILTDTLSQNCDLALAKAVSREQCFDNVNIAAAKLKEGDLLVAPFIRYRQLWRLVEKLPAGITTIHLSECLPDTFGHVGYRIAYRGKSIKSWLTLPLTKWYALRHKPDLCYFPLMPYVRNTFVKASHPVRRPPLSAAKTQILADLTRGIRRPLIIGGFGYDPSKMARALALNKYIATSKGIEIIIDGRSCSLPERICAEEVLLSGLVSRVVSYTSSAMAWAKVLNPDTPIDCFAASALDRQYGRLYTLFATRALRQLGIKVLPENKAMLA